MTVADLISQLSKLPDDIEIWSQDNQFAFPRTLEVVKVPIYENHWYDEGPCWETINGGEFSRKAKWVVMIQ